METAVVVGIVLIAAVLVIRSFVRKGRGEEGCGCDACALRDQCTEGGERPVSCEEEQK